VGGEGGGEDRRQRRHRAVHQSGEARLHIGEDELARSALVSFSLTALGHVLLLELLGQRFMALLGQREIVEQFAGRGVVVRLAAST
jgi:hypothetical protein